MVSRDFIERTKKTCAVAKKIFKTNPFRELRVFKVKNINSKESSPERKAKKYYAYDGRTNKENDIFNNNRDLLIKVRNKYISKAVNESKEWKRNELGKIDEEEQKIDMKLQEIDDLMKVAKTNDDFKKICDKQIEIRKKDKELDSQREAIKISREVTLGLLRLEWTALKGIYEKSGKEEDFLKWDACMIAEWFLIRGGC